MKIRLRPFLSKSLYIIQNRNCRKFSLGCLLCSLHAPTFYILYTESIFLSVCFLNMLTYKQGTSTHLLLMMIFHVVLIFFLFLVFLLVFSPSNLFLISLALIRFSLFSYSLLFPVYLCRLTIFWFFAPCLIFSLEELLEVVVLLPVKT